MADSGRYNWEEDHRSLGTMAIELSVRINDLMRSYMDILETEGAFDYDDEGKLRDLIDSCMVLLKDSVKYMIKSSYKMEAMDHKLDRITALLIAGYTPE